MALTVGAYMTKVLEQQYLELTVIVTITTQGSDTFVFTGGAFIDQPAAAAYLDHIHNVHSITPISPRIDPISRQVQTGAVTVTCADDGTIRDIIHDSGGDNTHLKNATMAITFASRHDLSATLPYWKGLIDDVLPSEGLIEIIGKDAIHLADNMRYYGCWLNKHPLELINDMIDAADIQSAFIDSTALDPDTDTDISHFVAGNHYLMGSVVEGDVESGHLGTNHGDAGGTTLTPRAFMYSDDDYTTKPGVQIRKSIEQLAFMMNGSVWCDESGKITFKRFDSSDSVVDTWGNHDIIEIKQTATYKNVINEVLVQVGTGEVPGLFRHRDTDAQTRYKMVGGTGGILQLAFRLPFGSQPVECNDIANGTVTTGFVLREATNLGGMCGTRVADTFRETASEWAAIKPFSQAAAAQLSATRKLFLMWEAEIISATGLTFTADIALELPDFDEYGEVLAAGTDSFYPQQVTLTGVTRGVGDSVGAQHYGVDQLNTNPVYDITMAKMLAEDIVARAANGIPEFEVVTSLAKYSTQIADLIEIDDDFPIFWGNGNGISSSDDVKLEVIGKEVDILGDPPQIRWTLAVASVDTPPWGTPTTGAIPIDPIYGVGRVGPPNLEVAANDTTSFNASEWTKVAYGSLLRQTGDGWDSSTNEYTVEVTGTYMVTAFAYIENLDNGDSARIALFIDDTYRAPGSMFYNNTGGDADCLLALFWMGVLTNGEVAEIRVWCSEANATTGDPEDNYFSIILMQS